LLTISQVAQRYQLNNRQVHELMEYGYLQVSQVLRNARGGVSYLFAEKELETVDIYSSLADLQDKKTRLKGRGLNKAQFSKVLKTIHHYDRFLENIAGLPGEEVLKISFYLFHLNHYAKRYPEQARDLYRLKNRVLKKLYQENPDFIQLRYLVGPDRKRIWLCDDCKDSARSAGLTFVEYLKKGYYCPKCFVQAVEPEYYSLYEFIIAQGNYRFVFHLPRSSAGRWLKNVSDMEQGRRETGPYEDHMYLYGRASTRIEEKSFPLPMVREALTAYLAQ